MHPARRSLLISPRIDFDSILLSEASIAAAVKSPNTRAAYFFAWRAFRIWCEAAGVAPLPADPRAVKNFTTWSLQQGYRINTVILRLTGIAHYHREAGLPSPIAGSDIWKHIDNARRHFKEEPRAKRAITSEMLRKVMYRLPDDALGARDRALLLLNFAAGWRKTEIARLRFSEVRFVPCGVELWLRSSKTDQVGEGRLVGIQPGDYALTCPIAALRAWIELRGTWEGPLFTRLTAKREITREPLGRRAQVIYLAVKKYLEAIGEDPRLFGAHSLRAGMVTEAAKNGASESAIMQRTGHKRSATLRKYIRPATAFDFNPLKGVL